MKHLPVLSLQLKTVAEAFAVGDGVGNGVGAALSATANACAAAPVRTRRVRRTRAIKNVGEPPQ